MEDFNEIVSRRYLALRPRFISLLSSRFPSLYCAEVEDIYQETFLAIRKNLMSGRIAENTSWNSYIFAIGLRMAERKVNKGWGFKHIYDCSDEEVTPPNTISADILRGLLDDDDKVLCDDHEAKDLLGEELSHTPEPCNSIISNFYYCNMSMDEIAKDVGFRNADSVKAKKSRCMSDLKKRVTTAFRNAGIIS